MRISRQCIEARKLGSRLTFTSRASRAPTEQPAQKSAALEEDDEFEDFPVDGTNNPYAAVLYLSAKTGGLQGGPNR